MSTKPAPKPRGRPSKPIPKLGAVAREDRQGRVLRREEAGPSASHRAQTSGGDG